MNRKLFLPVVAAAASLALFSGCYEYARPASATMGDTYTQREKDEKDELFKGLTSLTLADAQRISLINNPTYLSAYHAVSAARMRYYQAIGAYSPTVKAGFGAENNYSNYYNQTYYDNEYVTRDRSFTTQTTLTANLLLFDGFARTFKVLAAKHSMEYQKQMEADACRTLMLAVAQAYNQVLLAIEKRRIAEEDRDFQKISLKDTRYKFEAGAVPLSDVLNFEILMNNADVSMIAAEYQYETAIYALAVLMGYPAGILPEVIKFPTDFKDSFVELPAVEIYLDTALANRSDLKAYREQLEVARYQVYQTYSSYSPTVNAYAAFAFATNSAKNGQPSDYRSYFNSPKFSYGITADWTIFNGFIRYNTMREYQAAFAVADYNVANQWLSVVQEVRSAYATYVQSIRTTILYKKTRDLSAKQRDLVDDEYRAGNTELTRLNEAQRDLVQAETNLASSYINIENAKALLDSAVGVNSVDYYKNMSQKPDSVPGLGAAKLDQAALDTKQTVGALPPDRAVIPGVTDASEPAKFATKPATAPKAASPAAKPEVKPATAPKAAAPAAKPEEKPTTAPKAAAPVAAPVAKPEVKPAPVAAPAAKQEVKPATAPKAAAPVAAPVAKQEVKATEPKVAAPKAEATQTEAKSTEVPAIPQSPTAPPVR